MMEGGMGGSKVVVRGLEGLVAGGEDVCLDILGVLCSLRYV